MSKQRRTTYLYRVRGNGVRTGSEQHTGTFEGVLLRATRIAKTEFETWKPGEGPVVEVTDQASGERWEVWL